MTSQVVPGGGPIRVGVVGLSARRGWAATAHLPALRALEMFELRGVSAGSPESARAAADAHGVPLAFDDAATMAGSGEVDLVVIAVKVPHHRDLVDAVLGAGVPVLCEWPLGTDADQAERMATAAAVRGVPAFTGLQGRSAPALRHLRDLVSDGYLGEVLSTSLVASGVNWGGTVDTGRLYQLDRDLGATMLSIPFGHTLDVIEMVLGRPDRLTATTAVRRPTPRNIDTGDLVPSTAEDQIAITGVLPGGAVLAAHMRGGMSRGENFRWEINGTEGDLVVTVNPPMPQLGRVTLRGARGSRTALTELPVPARYHEVPALAGQGLDAVENLAHAYLRLHRRLTGGCGEVPDFAHAVRLHRLLDRIRAASGHDFPVPPSFSGAPGPTSR